MKFTALRVISRNLQRLSIAGTLFAGSIGQAEPASVGDDALFEQLDTDGNGTVSEAEIPSIHARLFSRLLRKADSDGDKSLSRNEFIAALIPTRPEKKLEAKQPDGYPQADAVRYLLLTMDTSRNSWIESDEVPDDLRAVYEMMAPRIDTNKNGTMDRYELSRGARELGQVAARYVARERIDLAGELKKLDRSQGKAAKRFDEPPGAFVSNLNDPRQARAVFTQFDANSDGKLVIAEMPEPLQRQSERMFRFADRDRDGGLSEREFLVAAERMSRALPGPSKKMDRDADSRAELKARKQAKSASIDSMPSESMQVEEMAAEDQ